MAAAGRRSPAAPVRLPRDARPRRLWRLTTRRHAARAFDGEGARLYGGRFNHSGVSVVYCASHLSLAVLELLVHVDPDLLPDRLVAIPATVPPALEILHLPARRLPRNWRAYPAPAELKDLGGAWLRSAASPLLAVPSAVVPPELNVLVNPAHPDAGRLAIGPPEPFVFDPRLRYSASPVGAGPRGMRVSAAQ